MPHKKYSHFSPEELATAYSPSSMVDDIMLYLQQYADLSKAEYDKAKNATLNIPYGEKPSNTIDFFAPTTTNQGGLFVYIHGGYWQQLSKKESAWMVGTVQNHGHSIAVVDYTLCPHISVAGIITECQHAIIHLVRNAEKLGFDPKKIVVVGSSAGGHLTTMMGLTEWADYGIENPLCGIVPVSGVYDLTPLVDTYINDPLKMTYQTAQDISPDYMDKIPPCPTIIAWGQYDTTEFIRQSKDYAQKLQIAGVNIHTLEVADKNHFDVILDFGTDNTDLMDMCLDLMGI